MANLNCLHWHDVKRNWHLRQAGQSRAGQDRAKPTCTGIIFTMQILIKALSASSPVLNCRNADVRLDSLVLSIACFALTYVMYLVVDPRL